MNNKGSFFQTERGKAAIKLGLWMVVIFILIAIVLFSERQNIVAPSDEEDNPVEQPAETYDFANYNDMQTSLLNNNYEYVYTITSGDTKYIFTGMKSDGKEIGFKEDVNGIIKYFIDATGTYQLMLDTAELYTDLYSGIDSSYLDISVLFENLSEFLYSVEKDGSIRTISYDKEGYQVTVITDTKNITNINVVTDTTNYELEFTKVGECATIDFSA